MIWFEASLSLPYRDLGALEVLYIYLLNCYQVTDSILCQSRLFRNLEMLGELLTQKPVDVVRARSLLVSEFIIIT